jgi:hypothetical protein
MNSPINSSLEFLRVNELSNLKNLLFSNVNVLERDMDAYWRGVLPSEVGKFICNILHLRIGIIRNADLYTEYGRY